jgi:inner membrane protein
MDPLTHALLGASAAQFAFGRRLPRRAWLVGAGAGLAPDLDFFIRNANDPLLNIELHRQFTHALAFIPIGGALTGLPWLLRRRARADWRPVLGAATLAYATHGLLDACTNYGTQLLWPFADLRVAWHLVTTIGPPITLLLLVGLLGTLLGGRRWPTALGLVGCLAYLCMAVGQQARGIAAQTLIADARGHAIVRAKLFPTVGNPVVWRAVYETDGVLYTDRIRLGSTPSFKPGNSVPLSAEASLPAALLRNPRVVRDYRRFSRFSDGWVARAPTDPKVFGDARYSLSTERFEPIWGVRFHPDRELPTEWVDFTRQNRVPLASLWREISGRDAAYRPLPAVPPG